MSRDVCYFNLYENEQYEQDKRGYEYSINELLIIFMFVLDIDTISWPYGTRLDVYKMIIHNLSPDAGTSTCINCIT